MIATLFRQDPSLRGLGFALLIGVALGAFFRSLTASLPTAADQLSRNARGWLLFAVGLVVCTALTALYSQNFVTRSSRMALALPIRAATLWRVRITSVLLTIVLPVAIATFGAASGAGGEVSRIVLLSGLRGCAALILAALLFQLPEFELNTTRIEPPFVVYVLFVSGAAVIYVLVTPASWISIAIPLLGAVGVAIWVDRHIPPAFLLSPTEPEVPLSEMEPAHTAGRDSDLSTPREAGSTSVRRDEGTESHSGEREERWILRRTIFHLLVNHWITWLVAVGCAFVAFAVVYGYRTGDNPMPNIIISLLWPVAILEQAVIRLYRLDYLPIPRPRLFSYIILALVVPLLLGTGVGALGFLSPIEASQIRYHEGRLQVPAEEWRLTARGQVEAVTAPWGESFTPRENPLFPGSSVVAYMPFESGEASSDRFRALQANRAVRTVYGRGLYREEESAAAGGKNPLVELLLSREEHGGDLSIPSPAAGSLSTRNRVYAISLSAGILLCTLIWSLNLLQHHPRFAGIFVRVCYFGLLGIVAVYYVGTIVEDLSGFSEALLVLPMILLKRLARLLPFSTPFLWLSNLPLALAGYFLLRALFGHIEAPLGKVKPFWKEYG